VLMIGLQWQFPSAVQGVAAGAERKPFSHVVTRKWFSAKFTGCGIEDDKIEK